LAWGNFDEDNGTVTGYIGRSPKDRRVFMMYDDEEKGRWSVTHYKVLERLQYVSLIECRLETGRTHQIRVHMKHIGHNLFSDDTYGGDRILKGPSFTKYKQFVDNCFQLMPRQGLHARSLGFVHPRTGQNMYFEAGQEPREGQLGVAFVTHNRMMNGNYPTSYCGVVKQKTNGTCQFSWWCETKARTASLRKEEHLSERQKEVYNEIKDIAVYVYMNHENIKDNTQGALYYHANYVNPRWKLKKTVTIGNHIFYTPY
jgi:hypothetical protein